MRVIGEKYGEGIVELELSRVELSRVEFSRVEFSRCGWRIFDRGSLTEEFWAEDIRWRNYGKTSCG